MWDRWRRDESTPAHGAVLITRGLLLFWSLWISLVVLANVVSELKALGVAPALWSLGSGNFQFIRKETALYSLPWWLDQVMFVGVVIWEAAAAVLFWRAFRHAWHHTRRRLRAAYTAHGVLMALFAAFILADEIFHDFRVEGDHRGVFVFLLVSLLAITVLPER